MIDMRVLTDEEYRSNLRREIEQDGLRKAVEKRCDDIVEECSSMPYLPHMTVAEWLDEILDLIDESEKLKSKRGKQE